MATTTDAARTAPTNTDFLAGGGEMAELVRSFDWGRTALGPIEEWPNALRTAVGSMLVSPVPIVTLWGEDGVMIYNDAYSVFAGGRHPQLLGSKVREGWPEVAEFNDHVMKVCLAGGTLSYKDQELTLHRHGRPEQVWMNLDYSPILDGHGRPAGVVAFVMETTERVRAERELRESEERFRNMADHAPVMMWVTEPDGSASYLNKCWYDFTGQTEEQALGFGWLSAVHPEDRGEAERAFVDANERRVPFRVEYRLRRQDGSYRWALDAAGPRFGPGGDFLGFIGSVIDIDERREVEDALRETTRRLDAIINNTEMAVFLMNERQHCVFANAAAEQLTGYRFEEMQGRPLHDVIHHKYPDGRHYPLEECPIDRAFPEENQVKGEELFVHKDGHFYPVAFTASPVRDDRGKPIGTIIEVRNIAEDKAQDAALQEERYRLDTLNRTGAAVAAELDLEKIVQLVTDAGVELTGAEFGAFFYNVIDNQGESYTLYALSGADRSAFENYPMPRNTAVFAPTFNGEGTVRSNDITKDPRYGKNAPYNGMPEGHLPVRSYLAVPVVSRSGEVLGGLFFGHALPGRFTETHEQLMVGIAAQASVAVDNARLYQALQRSNETLEQRVEERTAELAAANEALRQAQKMEAIGQLTGGIAHDFNNLLTVIRGSADVLQRRDLDPDKRHRYVQAIADTADRAARLTSQLLAFARRQALKPEVFEVSERVESIADMLRTVLGSRIALTIHRGCDGCFVEADAAQFETALVNMAVNARDAMDGEGEVTIAVGRMQALPRGSGDPPGEGFVTVGVTDTGHGIPREDLDRIFEPFFTTKETGKGTGLGLSQVYGFAKQSGGEILVDSEPGEGTTFTLFLPRTSPPQDHDEEQTRSSAEGAPNARILVVEDNEEVGRFAETVLSDLGFRTTRAASAVEALALLSAGGTFDIVFSDIVMPGQSGIDLAHEIRRRWPGLPVVLTTGYSDALALGHELPFPVVHKPYSLDALSEALAKALQH